MRTNSPSWCLLLWAYLVAACSASHFEGGIISFKSIGSDKTIEISYRTSWRNGSSQCNDYLIQSGSHVSMGTQLKCLSGCSLSGPQDYYCTDYNSGEGWSSGRNTFTHTFPYYQDHVEFGFSGSAWMGNLVNGGSNWELRVSANLSRRYDTGNINSSPFVDFPPITQVDSTCNREIQLPVSDADGDEIRCRWARSYEGECGGVCNGNSGASLNEDTCVLTVNYGASGYYAMAIQVEDFSADNPYTALSSIPVQFIVHANNSYDCWFHRTYQPTFVGATPENNATVNVNGGFLIQISSNYRVDELTTISPMGVVKSPIQLDGNHGYYNVYVNITDDYHINSTDVFCFAAFTPYTSSEQRCIHLDFNHTPIRLVDGRFPHEGRVEVYYQGRWGTVCDDSFDTKEAEVICTMLGYNTSEVVPNSFSGAHFGRGTGQIVVDDLDCNGDEDDISLCQSAPWLTHNCGHGEDASVDCGARLRLVSNNVVQVLHGGRWRPLCYSSSNFSPREATVACRSLGETGYSYYNTGNTGYVHSYHWSSGYRCDGTEDDLSMCPTTGIYERYGCQQIQLFCESSTTTTTTEPYSTTPTPWWHEQGGLTGLRLVNGPHTGAGRVELQYHGQWGTVCDDAFSNNDAQVICRMLGYVSNLGGARYHGSAFYGEGQGNIILDDLRCSGYEQDIRSCNKNPYFNNNCGHNEDVGVDCGTGIRLVAGSSPLDGVVEQLSHNSWNSPCASGVSEESASVICRQLGFKFPRNTTHNGHQYNYPIDHYGFICNGYERNIEECYKGPYHSCNQYNVASVDCRTPMRLDYTHMLEVNYAGIWRPVCDNNYQFDSREATAACKSMGYDNLSNYNRVGYSSRSFWRADYSCNTTGIDDFGWCLESDWSYAYGCYPIRLYCGHFQSTEETERPTSTPSYTEYPWWLTTGSTTTEELNPTSRTTAGSTYPWWLTATTSTPSYTEYPWWLTTATSTPSYTTYPWWLTTASYRSTPYWYRQTTQGIPLESAFTVGCDSTGWIIHVDMSRLRLIYPDARASDIYLGDNACSGTENGWDLTFRQSLLDCLTNRIVSGSNIIYRNELVYAMHDPQHPYIIRSYNWTVDVECDVTRSESASGHLHHDSSNHTDHQVATGSHYSINMTFYKDAGFIHPIQGNPLHISVGTDVYVKVFTTAGDWSIKMKLHSCYTKPSPSAADHLKYYVIRNGCEVDSSTHIISQSTHETRFVFRDFEYTTNHEGIYIYCESVFCPTSDYSTQCLQTCNPNRKRSIQLDPKATSTVARKIVHVK